MFSNLNLNPRRNQAAIEASKRRLLESTYTTPLGLDAASDSDDDADLHAVRDFLHQFYPKFYNKSSIIERLQIVKDYPEVASFYKRLVKTKDSIAEGAADLLSEEEFWQRYYYRCSPDQILLEWDRHPERARQIMGEAVSTWFKNTVGNSYSNDTNSDCINDIGNAGGVTKKEDTLFKSTVTDRSSARNHQQPPSSDSVSWFDAKWDSIKKAWVLPKEEDSCSAHNVSSNSTKIDYNAATSKNDKPLLTQLEDEKHGSIMETASSTTTNSAGTIKKSIPTSASRGAYVPPHKRGKVLKMVGTNGNTQNDQRASTPSKSGTTASAASKPSINSSNDTDKSMNTRAAGLQSGSNNSMSSQRKSGAYVAIDVVKPTASNGENETPTTVTNKETSSATETMSQKSNPSQGPAKNNINKAEVSLSSMLILCFISAVFILLFSQREDICTSNNPFWSPLLLCPNIPTERLRQSSNQMIDFTGTKKKRNNNKKVQLQNNGGDPSRARMEKGYDDSIDTPTDNDSDGLVNNLISSWMQSTDMAQLLNGGMAEQLQMRQQSGNDIALLPLYQQQQQDNNNPTKKKKRGPIQFFKRKFGRNKNDDGLALAVNNNHGDNDNNNHQGSYIGGHHLSAHRPQMVVHQHVHHVVHHVVHEYADHNQS